MTTNLKFVPTHTNNRLTVLDVLEFAQKGEIDLYIKNHKKINLHAIKEKNGEIVEIHNLRLLGFFRVPKDRIKPVGESSINYVEIGCVSWPNIHIEKNSRLNSILFSSGYKYKLSVKHIFTKYDNPEDCFENNLKINLASPPDDFEVFVDVNQLDQLY